MTLNENEADFCVPNTINNIMAPLDFMDIDRELRKKESKRD